MKSSRSTLLLIAAGAAIALLVSDRLVITPLSSNWKRRTTAISELRKKVDDGQRLLQRGQGLRDRWSQMRTNTLPNSRPVAEEQILKAFDRWSQDSRLSIMSISPQWKQETEDYLTLDFRVEASGSLAAVTRFLHDVEKDPMALKIQTVELSSRDNEGQQMALGLQVSGLVLVPKKEQLRR